MHSREEVSEGEEAPVVTGDEALVHNGEVIETLAQFLLQQKVTVDVVQVETRVHLRR